MQSAGGLNSSLTKTFDVYNFFTILIRMDNGVITKIDWDNGCYLCDISMCFTFTPLDYLSGNATTGSSGCKTANCFTSSNTTGSCDPQVYVAFVGTDSAGQSMESAGLRIAAFRQFSISSSYTSALAQFNSVKGQIQTNVNSIGNVIISSIIVCDSETLMWFFAIFVESSPFPAERW